MTQDISTLSQRLRAIERAEHEYVDPRQALAQERASVEAQIKAAQQQEELRAIEAAINELAATKQANTAEIAALEAAISEFVRAVMPLMPSVAAKAQALDTSHTKRQDQARRILGAVDAQVITTSREQNKAPDATPLFQAQDRLSRQKTQNTSVVLARLTAQATNDQQRLVLRALEVALTGDFSQQNLLPGGTFDLQSKIDSINVDRPDRW